jgi:hypothetical protein
MVSFRKSRDGVSETPPVVTRNVEVDLARLDHLIDISIRLRGLGVDFASVEDRAARDATSFNEALEAIDAELPPDAVRALEAEPLG